MSDNQLIFIGFILVSISINAWFYYKDRKTLAELKQMAAEVDRAIDKYLAMKMKDMFDEQEK